MKGCFGWKVLNQRCDVVERRLLRDIGGNRIGRVRGAGVGQVATGDGEHSERFIAWRGREGVGTYFMLAL